MPHLHDFEKNDASGRTLTQDRGRQTDRTQSRPLSHAKACLGIRYNLRETWYNIQI